MKGRNEDKSLTIRYKMFFRTTSKAKSGSVMFINADSYDKAYKWLSMGLTERIKPNEPFKLVELKTLYNINPQNLLKIFSKNT